MTGRDVLKKVTESRSPEQLFIKWNRKENDFADYDLIDRFVKNLSVSEEFEEVELLTMEEMFSKIKNLTGDRVRRVKVNNGENVEWQHKGKSGVTTQTCPYIPETLMTIFDVETKGDTIG